MKAVLLALLMFAAGSPATAELLWNRSGLPATFPLQVQSDPGLHWRVTLRDADTEEPALAAHFEGGAFFRVLVPPGTYVLHFEAGPHWTGEGFGPDGPSRSFDFDRPLTFEVRGVGRKAGHIVDLRGEDEMAAASARRQVICQDRRLDRVPDGPILLADREDMREGRPFDPFRFVEREVERPLFPRFRAEVAARYC
ncbi:hypothetical protein [Tranquillimonas rosea]|uniref:hypothetical protein n=1 Tax=Tranquillimonas rosea TaxID=641238 RepID=UPI003BA9FEAE